MNREFLKLIPKRYLCPYCGEWHTWELSYNLGRYTETYRATLGCQNQNTDCSHRETEIFFSDLRCFYKTTPTCNRASFMTNNSIPIEDIVESSEEPRVTFATEFTARSSVGFFKCSDCPSVNNCLICKLGAEGDGYDMQIPFGLEFEQAEYDEIVGVKHTHEKHQTSETPNISQKQSKENKEDIVMGKNNIFNMNLEFGSCTDENIASTLMGVAVKNGNSWRIYDKEKKEITDVGDMQLGNLPIFIMPTTQLKEGDLIKDNDEYYFVTKVATAKTHTETFSARTGEIKNVVPIKNILGFSCYSKVIALSDSFSIGDDFDVEKLAIMSTMFGQNDKNGSQMNQLLPLMLFKDKLGGDYDTMKLFLMSSMMNNEGDNSQMNQLLPLMLFKDKLGGDDDMMKMMLMSSMMGNADGNNNPLMSYLMLDTFMGKKDANPVEAENE